MQKNKQLTLSILSVKLLLSTIYDKSYFFEGYYENFDLR